MADEIAELVEAIQRGDTETIRRICGTKWNAMAVALRLVDAMKGIEADTSFVEVDSDGEIVERPAPTA